VIPARGGSEQAIALC